MLNALSVMFIHTHKKKIYKGLDPVFSAFPVHVLTFYPLNFHPEDINFVIVQG